VSQDAGSFDSFGCQAMTKPYIFHVVVQDNPEDELKLRAILEPKDTLDFSWLDIVFIIDFEHLKPPQEVFNSALELIL
jgi:hypothetical protein